MLSLIPAAQIAETTLSFALSRITAPVSYEDRTSARVWFVYMKNLFLLPLNVTCKLAIPPLLVDFAATRYQHNPVIAIKATIMTWGGCFCAVTFAFLDSENVSRLLVSQVYPAVFLPCCRLSYILLCVIRQIYTSSNDRDSKSRRVAWSKKKLPITHPKWNVRPI